MTDTSPLTEQELDGFCLRNFSWDECECCVKRQRLIVEVRRFRVLAARVTPEMLNGIHGHGNFHGERTKAYALLRDLREAGQ